MSKSFFDGLTEKFKQGAAVDLRHNPTIRSRRNFFRRSSYNWFPTDTMERFVQILTSGSDFVMGHQFADAINDLIDKVSTINTRHNSPFIYCAEFQPDPTFVFMTKILLGANEFWKDAVSDINNIGEFWEKIKNVFSYDEIKNLYGLNSDSFNDATWRTNIVPNTYYNKIMSGYWMTAYELPFYNANIFDVQQSGGWKVQSLFSSVPAAKSLANLFGLNEFDITTPPRYTVPDESNKEIRTAFTLFNDTEHAVINNSDLIYHLVGAAMWVQDTIVRRGTNLFSIFVPGRFAYHLCGLDIKVTGLGKQRKPHKDFDIGTQSPFRNVYVVGRLMPVMTRIFDAYRVECTFKPLTPDNFSNFSAIYSQEHPHAALQNVLNSRGIASVKQKSFLEDIFKNRQSEAVIAEIG